MNANLSSPCPPPLARVMAVAALALVLAACSRGWSAQSAHAAAPPPASAPSPALALAGAAAQPTDAGPQVTEPVRGLPAYAAKIADLLAAYPDIRLELVDSATVPANAADEELVFLHYVGQGTGPAGPFEFRGLDRVRTRDGIVVENVVRYDPSELP